MINVKFSRLGEYGTDIAGQILLSIIIINYIKSIVYKETINKIYSERKKIYNESNFKIKCDSLDVEKIVIKIIKLYENARNKS